MRDYRDLRRVYNLTLTQAFFALVEQKVLDVWEQLAKLGYNAKDWLDFTEKRWKALPVERQIAYASGYQKWYAERLGVGVEQSFEGSVFRLIPPGKFTMGSPKSEPNRYQDEQQKKVRIKAPLWVGRYPVTQAEYERVNGNVYSAFLGKNHPVDSLILVEAKGYCVKSGCQLLSDIEWEYACRAGTTTAYSFGDNPYLLEDYAWYTKNSRYGTHPVGEKKANAWGIHDMHGNVWEWTNDVWSGIGTYNVVRGAGWFNFDYSCRSANRGRRLSSSPGDAIGFRVCRLFS